MGQTNGPFSVGNKLIGVSVNHVQFIIQTPCENVRKIMELTTETIIQFAFVNEVGL